MIPSKAFENLCRKIVGTYFGVSLSKGMVSGVPTEFDMASSDGKMVGDAKYFTMVRGKGIPPAKFVTISEHVWLLEKTSADRKFLIFGNDRRVPMEWLKRYGHLAKTVEFYFVDARTEKLQKLN